MCNLFFLQIYSIKLDPWRESEHITDFNVSFPWSPTAFAIDWIGNKIYVCDAIGQKIDVMELDGSQHTILISRNLSSPLDIALDPHLGYVYHSKIFGDVCTIVLAVLFCC